MLFRSVPTDDSAAGDTGPSAGSTSCYVDVQFICDELPDATETDAQNLAVSCSSRSGVYAQPADCPTDGYEGKCSVGSGTAETVQRFYTGADVTYAADFCVNTAGGTWTTDW